MTPIRFIQSAVFQAKTYTPHFLKYKIAQPVDRVVSTPASWIADILIPRSKAGIGDLHAKDTKTLHSLRMAIYNGLKNRINKGTTNESLISNPALIKIRLYKTLRIATYVALVYGLYEGGKALVQKFGK